MAEELKPSEKRKQRKRDPKEEYHIQSHQSRKRRKDGLNFRRKRKQFEFGVFKARLILVGQVAGTILLALLLVRSFGIHINIIGESMEPTLEEDEKVLLNRVAYLFSSPKAGDVIAFYPGGNQNASLSVKRIIATPGQRVRIANGAVYINDNVYRGMEENDYIEDAGLAENEILLEEGEYFVLGDNRENSEDSRYESIGNIKKGEIAGKLWLTINGTRFGMVQ